MSDLEGMVRDLTDRAEIRELVARYNRAADDGDHEAYVAAFTDDGVFEVAGHSIAGAGALLAYIRSSPYGTVHMTLDPIIEIDGDRAVHTCTFLIARRSADKHTNRVVATGRYHDELRRTPSGWRFTRRRFDSDLAFDQLSQGFTDAVDG